MTHATLLPEGGDLQDTLVTQEALTCIANALLLEEDARDLFNKYEGVEGLTRELKVNEGKTRFASIGKFLIVCRC